MDIKLYNSYKNKKTEFIDSVLKIHDYKTGMYKSAKLIKHQKDIMQVQDFLLVKKESRCGVTEAFISDIIYNLNYNNNFNMLYVGHISPAIADVKYRVAIQFKQIPDNIRIPSSNSLVKQNFGTDINSFIEFRVANINIGRSQTYDVIYIDEASGIKNFDEIYGSLAACVSRAGRMLISSSTFGNNSGFDYLWNSSNKFTKLSVNSSMMSNIFTSKYSLNKKSYDEIIKECIIH